MCFVPFTKRTSCFVVTVVSMSDAFLYCYPPMSGARSVLEKMRKIVRQIDAAILEQKEVKAKAKAELMAIAKERNLIAPDGKSIKNSKAAPPAPAPTPAPAQPEKKSVLNMFQSIKAKVTGAPAPAPAVDGSAAQQSQPTTNSKSNSNTSARRMSSGSSSTGKRRHKDRSATSGTGAYEPSECDSYIEAFNEDGGSDDDDNMLSDFVDSEGGEDDDDNDDDDDDYGAGAAGGGGRGTSDGFGSLKLGELGVMGYKSPKPYSDGVPLPLPPTSSSSRQPQSPQPGTGTVSSEKEQEQLLADLEDSLGRKETELEAHMRKWRQKKATPSASPLPTTPSSQLPIPGRSTPAGGTSGASASATPFGASITPSNSTSTPVSGVNVGGGLGTGDGTFVVGQRVMYRGVLARMELAVVKAVHRDDPPNVYYTIELESTKKEKQVDVDRLTPAPETVSVPTPATTPSPSVAAVSASPSYITPPITQGITQKFSSRDSSARRKLAPTDVIDSQQFEL